MAYGTCSALVGALILASVAAVGGVDYGEPPPVAPVRADRIILGFSGTPEAWVLNARLRHDGRRDEGAARRLAGGLSCSGGACPGRAARAAGTVGGTPRIVDVRARFRRGVTCRFTGSLEPPAGGRIACRGRGGAIVLDEPFVLGVCRCVTGSAGAKSLCAPSPCPY